VREHTARCVFTRWYESDRKTREYYSIRLKDASAILTRHCSTKESNKNSEYKKKPPRLFSTTNNILISFETSSTAHTHRRLRKIKSYDWKWSREPFDAVFASRTITCPMNLGTWGIPYSDEKFWSGFGKMQLSVLREQSEGGGGSADFFFRIANCRTSIGLLSKGSSLTCPKFYSPRVIGPAKCCWNGSRRFFRNSFRVSFPYSSSCGFRLLFRRKTSPKGSRFETTKECHTKLAPLSYTYTEPKHL